jgi:hypothetical protein
MCLKIIFYGDHSPKDYKIFTMVFTIISTFYFFQGFLFTYDVFTNFDPNNNMKLLNVNYEPKAPISTPYILEGKKWMNSQPHSFTYIPHVSSPHT